MPEIDLTTKTDNEIDTWIGNYERKGATADALYKKLLEERAKRQSRGLKIEVSLRHLHEAAFAERFTTYGDLAEANGVPWNLARHAMNGSHGHLDILLDVCHARGIPLLTAVCVNQGGLASGELSEEALRGFVSGAKRVGYYVTDEKAFLSACQRECFEWARSHPPGSA
ncbi:hypothetical protein HAP47_0009910 [Bradyrhizobium sp. 41S5]|uniref:hypothetical protein n=1 Tax=Bradyrhizobium sp. 41S5 TaxID=1404443 RepID=UPI00156B45A9|nr:hypothetical protein [Bradyrhizobium sp. 41S5]UFX46950.1 hypothetical protein HAP47_0009910 [Bradyrhizobium sp. 41S5]